MKKTLMTAALVGTAFGGYHFAHSAQYRELYGIMPSSVDARLENGHEQSETIAAYGYYQQPDVDVTFDGEVIYVWED